MARACREAGIDAEGVIWDAPGVEWDGIRPRPDPLDLGLPDEAAGVPRLGRAHRRPAAEPAGDDRLEPLQALPRLCSQGWGFPVVPTAFVEPGTGPADEALSRRCPRPVSTCSSRRSRPARSTRRATSRPTTASASALSVTAASSLASGRTVIVQPFLASVETEAETAVVLLGGEPVHAMRKGPLLELGQGLEQGLFREEEMPLREAQRAMSCASPRPSSSASSAEVAMPLYARVDMLRDEAGTPTCARARADRALALPGLQRCRRSPGSSSCSARELQRARRAAPMRPRRRAAAPAAGGRGRPRRRRASPGPSPGTSPGAPGRCPTRRTREAALRACSRADIGERFLTLGRASTIAGAARQPVGSRRRSAPERRRLGARRDEDLRRLRRARGGAARGRRAARLAAARGRLLVPGHDRDRARARCGGASAAACSTTTSRRSTPPASPPASTPTRAENIGFYARRGFEVVAEAPLPATAPTST